MNSLRPFWVTSARPIRSCGSKISPWKTWRRPTRTPSSIWQSYFPASINPPTGCPRLNSGSAHKCDFLKIIPILHRNWRLRSWEEALSGKLIAAGSGLPSSRFRRYGTLKYSDDWGFTIYEVFQTCVAQPSSAVCLRLEHFALTMKNRQSYLRTNLFCRFRQPCRILQHLLEHLFRQLAG